jgi:hypothetical protein
MEAVQGFSNFIILQAIEDLGLFPELLVFGPEAFVGVCPGFGSNHILLVGHGLSSVIKSASSLRNWLQHEAFAPARVERNQLCDTHRCAGCLEPATDPGTRFGEA